MLQVCEVRAIFNMVSFDLYYINVLKNNFSIPNFLFPPPLVSKASPLLAGYLGSDTLSSLVEACTFLSLRSVIPASWHRCPYPNQLSLSPSTIQWVHTTPTYTAYSLVPSPQV